MRKQACWQARWHWSAGAGMLPFFAYAIRKLQAMIIKEADDKKPAIQALQALLSRPDCKQARC